MRKHDRGVAVFLLLLGLSAAIQASRLRIGEPGRPGPGLFPFCLAAALCLVSVGLLLRSLPRGMRPAAAPANSLSHSLLHSLLHSLSQGNRKKVLWSLLALAGYAFALEPLGFALATFLFLLFLYRVVEPQRWRAALGGSLIATLLTYTLFQLLQVQLPAGLWMR